MASEVGTTISFTPRASASCFTSSMTGNRPYVPVPMIRRVQCHGIFSANEGGV
jgi:hypothetical protein